MVQEEEEQNIKEKNDSLPIFYKWLVRYTMRVVHIAYDRHPRFIRITFDHVQNKTKCVGREIFSILDIYLWRNKNVWR